MSMLNLLLPRRRPSSASPDVEALTSPASMGSGGGGGPGPFQHRRDPRSAIGAESPSLTIHDGLGLTTDDLELRAKASSTTRHRPCVDG
jgi:hypothetical protein